MTRQHLIQAWALQLSPLYPAREAELICRYLLEDLLPGHSGPLSAEQLAWLESEIWPRLQAGEPWQYLSGYADFYGWRFRVSPAVLIPRPETEELVAAVLERLGRPASGKLLDLGTGSGCIALGLGKALPQGWALWGLDLSAQALALARANAQDLGLSERFHALEADGLAPETWQKLRDFDLIVSNPPYILREEAEQMRDNVLRHEPDMALFVSNGDPLQFYRVLAEQSAQALKPSGLLAAELNEFHAQACLELWQACPWLQDCQIQLDMQGKARMLFAQRV